MKYIHLVYGLVLISASAGPAQAQNFTFQASGNAPTMVGGPDMAGNMILGATWTGISTVTWADGKKTVDKFTCISTTQPANAKIFDMHTICDGSSADGAFTSAWGCNWTSKDRASTGCVGGLTGRTGIYAGRGGAITFGGKNGIGGGAGFWGPVASGN